MFPTAWHVKKWPKRDFSQLLTLAVRRCGGVRDCFGLLRPTQSLSIFVGWVFRPARQTSAWRVERSSKAIRRLRFRLACGTRIAPLDANRHNRIRSHPVGQSGRDDGTRDERALGYRVAPAAGIEGSRLAQYRRGEAGTVKKQIAGNR